MAVNLLDLVRRVIGFDTVSRNSNLALVDFLDELLVGLGFRVERYFSEEKDKANLFATLGPVDRPGLMLAGHMDVVPVDGQDWHSDPFKLTEKDGSFYGRGTADMKSFIAQAICAADAVRNRALKLPLHLVFTYDEEVGCHGAARMMGQLAEQDHVMPRCAIVGEPSNFGVFNIHKGFAVGRVRFKGVEGHSSKPGLGANAIYPAAAVITKLREVEAERKLHRSLEDLFEIPHTTLNVGLTEGGNAVNIIPNHAEVTFEYRTMPGEDPDYVLNQVRGYVSEVLLPDFRKQHPAVDIQVDDVGRGMPMQAPPGSEIELLALELTGGAKPGAAPYYTEGAIFNEAGIPTVICGPGDIDQAHRPNEFITREQLDKGVPFLGKLIERVCLS